MAIIFLMDEIIQQLAQTLREASANKTPLRIIGGGTKDFYGNPTTGEALSTSAYRGIVEYEPTELVITARAGTPLTEIEAALKEKGQMLAFEPPHFSRDESTLNPPGNPLSRRAGEGWGEGGKTSPPSPSCAPSPPPGSAPLATLSPQAGEGKSTLGGCIAAGLSGPRRPYAGAVRDLLLGVRLLDGTGADLRFGGQVMKNVAGYDVSRLMAGSMGTLGVILEVSLKTLPLPATEITLHQQHTEAEAIRLMNTWAGQPLPISATAWSGGNLRIRLSGAASAVAAARKKLGGEVVDAAPANAFWQGIRDHHDSFFAHSDAMLWRLSVKSTAPVLKLPGTTLIEWSGALRWLRAETSAEMVRAAAAQAGGHATLFRGGSGSSARAGGVFHPLPKPLAALHKKLKQTFDPAGILNPGRLYPGL